MSSLHAWKKKNYLPKRYKNFLKLKSVLFFDFRLIRFNKNGKFNRQSIIYLTSSTVSPRARSIRVWYISLNKLIVNSSILTKGCKTITLLAAKKKLQTHTCNNFWNFYFILVSLLIYQLCSDKNKLKKKKEIIKLN